MKRYLVAAVLISAFAAPVLATEGFYVVFDNSTGKCFITTSAPTRTTRYTIMGSYSTKGAAHKAMAKMKDCK